VRVDVVLGLQWGDEGKGKIVDALAEGYEVVARFQGGPNAGHTLYHHGQKVVLHQVPAGIFHDNVRCLIGDGVVIDPEILVQEVAGLSQMGVQVEERLYIGRGVHLILPVHRWLEDVSQDAEKIGTTRRGIGPAYADRYARRGIAIADLEKPDYHQRILELTAYHEKQFPGAPPVELSERFWEALESLRRLRWVSTYEWLRQHRRILAEGSQGTLLDVFAGSYPYVTSSHTTVAGACAGLLVAPREIGQVWGVIKAYATRVGAGPFPTEITGELAAWLQERGGERGSTTGRLRRCGWLDLPLLKYAIAINGVTALIVTKGDVLSGLPTVKVRVGGSDEAPRYEEFPGWESIADPNYEAFLRWIEAQTGIPVWAISTGPHRQDWQIRRKDLLVEKT
jgi:adenylosuccinate synthase